MERITRRERRALRQQKFVADKEARLAARLAHLDYKVANESGALRVSTHSLTWHLAKRANWAKPRGGPGWDRSGPTYVVEGLGTLTKPITHQQWRRLIATKAPGNTNK